MVRLNNAEFNRKGSVVIVTRVAQVKYTDKHFKEVDRLIRKGYTKRAAYGEVAIGPIFDADNLGRAYRARHENKKTRLQDAKL